MIGNVDAVASRPASSASSASGSMSVKSRVLLPTQALWLRSAVLAVQAKWPVGWTWRSRRPVLDPR